MLYLQLIIQLLILRCTNIYASNTHIKIGCFVDKSKRAISGGYVTFPRNIVVQKCHDKAKRAGNSYFAVQNGVECFTSPDAGITYDKYGISSGCTHGRGGHWRMTVYLIPSRDEVMGCFVDKPKRAISGGFVTFAPDVVIHKCRERARRAANSYFAIQNGVECFTSPDAGKTYNKYGSSWGCSHGRGGHWRMTVYRIPQLSVKIGCFVDKSKRAISGGYVTFPRDIVVQKCHDIAKRAGNSYFAVQNGVECFTSPDAGITYDKYGISSGCTHGRGGHWRMTVYRIPSPDIVMGCFVDRSKRAISGGYVNFSPDAVIQKCHEKANKAGNSYFAIQNGVECFTSPEAGETYNKYGSSSGCSHGRGGHWRMTVYRIPHLSVNIGCFVDKSKRAISGGYVTFPGDVVIDMCHDKAKRAGNTYFAVQNGVECFTSPDAGITYDKYGISSGCTHGRGGFWRMTVYRIPSRDIILGCFIDKTERAISGGYMIFAADVVIHKCRERARRAGNSYFAIQAGVQCFTSPEAGETYNKYGSSSGCSHGRGGHWRMTVYKFI